jgi:NADPH2:quinone reductase
LRDTFSSQGIELVDVVLDVVGGDLFDAIIHCLSPGRRLIVVGFASGPISTLKTNYPVLKEIAVIDFSLENIIKRRDPVLRDLMEKIYDVIAAGRFDPFVTANYPISKFHRAAEQISSRNAIGKIILSP